MSRPIVRVTKRNERIILAIGLLAGVAVAAYGPRPTGSTAVDVVLTVAAVTAVTWAGATAPWWALIVTSGLGAAASPSLWMMALGAIAFAGSARLGVRQKGQVLERAVISGITLVVLAHLGTAVFFGFTSLAGISAAAVLAGLGLWRRPAFEVKISGWVIAGALGYCVLATGAFAIAGLGVRSELSDGNSAARAGLGQLKQGNFDRAQESFSTSARLFESANAALDKPWVQLARLVPVIGQHRTAADELASGAAAATRAIDIELRRIDFDTLTVKNGRIDLDAVRALQEPMHNLQSALDLLDTAVETARSPWLIDSIQIRIDDLSVEIAQQRELGEKALTALELAPAMLGAEGERVYFVMFTTLAEARGQGGFMGNYAELSLDNGHIEMTAFGGKEDLVKSTEHGIRISGPEDWLTSYGVFGFQSGPENLFDPRAWLNITMSPNFPSTAQIVAELYPQSGGREVDGVINLDVFALQELIGLVGPLDFDGMSKPLTGKNTANFLHVAQYFNLDKSARTDMLQRVAEQTVKRLLEVSPPDLIEVGKVFVPLVRDRNVMMWARDSVEQTLLIDAHIDASLPAGLDGANALAVTVNNASGNKIDSFLERDYTYEATTDESGNLIGQLTLVLRNTAPAGDLPDYIIGNEVDQPAGTNRMFLTVFSTVPVTEATVDGQARVMFAGSEQGLRTYSTYVDIAANDHADVILTLAGPPPTPPYNLITQSQPGVTQEQWRIDTSFPATVTAR